MSHFLGLSDAQWAQIEPHVPKKAVGRPLRWMTHRRNQAMVFIYPTLIGQAADFLCGPSLSQNRISQL